MTITNELTTTSMCVSCGRETSGMIFLDHCGPHMKCAHCGASFDVLPDTGCSIKQFRGDYAFLSNFYPCHIEYDGLVFSSAESAYQAQKCTDYTEREAFQYYSGRGAKIEGRHVRLRSGWDTMKADILKEILYIKFNTSPHLKRLLMGTGSSNITEYNTWHDNYFGNCYCLKCCKKPGENKLGTMLMELRSSFKATKSTAR